MYLLILSKRVRQKWECITAFSGRFRESLTWSYPSEIDENIFLSYKKLFCATFLKRKFPKLFLKSLC